jgi:hypothetical protein
MFIEFHPSINIFIQFDKFNPLIFFSIDDFQNVFVAFE